MTSLRRVEEVNRDCISVYLVLVLFFSLAVSGTGLLLGGGVCLPLRGGADFLIRGKIFSSLHSQDVRLE